MLKGVETKEATVPIGSLPTELWSWRIQQPPLPDYPCTGNQTLKGKGRNWERSLERVQEIPSINWSWFRNLQGSLELTQETSVFCGLGQDGLNARINYYAIIGSVWRSMDIHYLCEKVINNAKNSTKLQQSGYLYFPFPCWQDHWLSVVRRNSVKCAGSSYTRLVPDVPEGRAVLLPFRLG